MLSTIFWEMRLDSGEPGWLFSRRAYSFCKDWAFVAGALRAAETDTAPPRR